MKRKKHKKKKKKIINIEGNSEKEKLEGEIFLAEGIESSRFSLRAKSGRVALTTEKGLRENNEDALILDVERDAFAVIDGMGGYAKGEVAARIVAEAIRDDFKKPKADPQNLHVQAHLRMRKEGLEEGGAVYLAVRIERNGKALMIYQGGDCQLMIIDKRGNIKFFSEPTALIDAPTAYSPGKPKIDKVGIDPVIENHDIIIAATDGFWDNVETAKVAKIVSGEKIEEALPELTKLAKKDMIEGMIEKHGYHNHGNPDNITIILYQILPLSLRC